MNAAPSAPARERRRRPAPTSRARKNGCAYIVRIMGCSTHGGSALVGKIPTVYDVATRAGVSIATVSRVFSRPESVKDETRRRVLESVDALGYVPSGAARGLAARRTGVLGLFFPGLDA